MAKITLKGTQINTTGELPVKGSAAPEFTLVKQDLSETILADYKGQRLILNIFPSIDTGVCATSVRRFNEEAAELDNTVVLCVSMDLPFAMGRFCGAEGIENVVPVSAFRSGFGDRYGVLVADGPLAGLLSRAVVVIDGAGNVVYTEQVSEITQEPDYDAALAVL
ncbi:MAG: thiol peroxidase [Verrucomicrobia bacterium]|nr:thiol peroxidase [Verrucomicrobiota bacterium]